MGVGGCGGRHGCQRPRVPAWADDDGVEQIPTALADQWHAGWCNKSEEGYSVLIDLASLDPKDRGDLNPTTTSYTDAHGKDGWFVRCHKGLEPVKYAPSGEWAAEYQSATGPSTGPSMAMLPHQPRLPHRVRSQLRLWYRPRRVIRLQQ